MRMNDLSQTLRRQGCRRACLVLVVGRVGLRFQNSERDCPLPGCLPFRCSQGRSLARIARLQHRWIHRTPGPSRHRHAPAAQPPGPGFDPHRCPEQSRCEVHYASQRDGTRCELGSHPYSDSPVAVGQDGAGCVSRPLRQRRARHEATIPGWEDSRGNGGSAQHRRTDDLPLRRHGIAIVPLRPAQGALP